MTINKEDSEYEIKFWGDWLGADPLKRAKLVENLPIIKSIWDLKELPEKMRDYSFASMLNSFFGDLESAVYTKIRLEMKENKSKN